MKVLITGGSGNIGKVCAQHLKANQVDVVTISLDEKNEGFTHYQCDITNKEAVSHIIHQEKPDSVIHLASLLNSASRANPDGAVQVNLMGTFNLIEVAKEIPYRLIFGSSFNAIGNPLDYASDKEFVEKDDCKPIEFYGLTKYYIEQLGTQMRELKNTNFVSARIPTICGLGQASKNSPWREDIYTQKGNIELGFRKEVYVPLADVSEVAKSLCLLATAKEVKQSLYNLPNDSIKMEDLAKYVKSMNPTIEVNYRDNVVTGCSNFISANEFIDEFNYEYKKVFDHIKEVSHENS